MSKSKDATRAAVVHIRAGYPGESEQMDALLASLPVRIITWADVYRGLARLGRLVKIRSELESLKAIVVEVAALGSAEMDFFSIVSRALPQVPVLVYGPAAASVRIAEAVSHGAAGLATQEVISRIAALSEAEESASPAGMREAQACSAPERVFLDERIADVPSVPIAQPGTSTPGAKPPADNAPLQVEEDATEDDDRSAARVPWLRYDGGPARRAPSRVATPPTEPAGDDVAENGAGSREERDADSEPLLTEEELQALIGDDISAIAPRNPSRRHPTDGTQDGGES